MKVDITPPTGYTYVLYESKGKLLGLAATKEQMYTKYQIHKKTKIQPTNVTQLIRKFGHSTVNQMLKQFGNLWCTKSGQIFYKPKEERVA